MRKDSQRVKEIVNIAIGVATIIGGGFFILQLSMIFPLPGVKYMMMSPFLSMVIYILLNRIQSKFALIKIGSVFGLIMTFINLFMGLAIIITSILTQASILLIQAPRKKALYGAILFSGYTGFCALTISKYIVGGVFMEISLSWLLLTGAICLVFGAIGTYLAGKLMKYIKIF